MVRPQLRSGRYRKVFVRTPSKTVTRYVRKKPRQAHCSTCGGHLHGIPRALPSKWRHMPKSSKRPNRPFGGKLCTRCMRTTINT